MRMRSLLGALATLLAFATSTSVPAAGPDWPKSLTLGTASPGGVYYVYGEVLAQILTEKLGITVNPLPTQGPAHNVKLLDSGGAQLSFTDSAMCRIRAAMASSPSLQSWCHRGLG